MEQKKAWLICLLLFVAILFTGCSSSPRSVSSDEGKVNQSIAVVWSSRVEDGKYLLDAFNTGRTDRFLCTTVTVEMRMPIAPSRPDLHVPKFIPARIEGSPARSFAIIHGQGMPLPNFIGVARRTYVIEMTEEIEIKKGKAVEVRFSELVADNNKLVEIESTSPVE